ncbi:ABC transporter permease [Mangrovactinospora gilvigrisea]|uniref:ABC transporter permease n=1 Tax=Mangrovactinospora gilvigrisea TaxID=1428644 RepID=A0A1J7C1C1_9ACTN|nr:ABC transporter permease [Mangrovactinospora gilvigrisea]
MRRGAAAGRHAIALLLTALYLVPMLYIVLVSLTPDGQSTTVLPSHLAFGNFRTALAAADFGRFFLNSAFVTVVASASQVVLSCMAGYALARLPLKSARTVMALLIGLLVVPPEIVMVPLFVMVTHVPFLAGNNQFGSGGEGMLDSYATLMLPHLGSALAIFLMRQFYRDLPGELGQAARVDGASEVMIFARIYTPLTLPAVAVVTVLAFQSAWNDFLWPLITVRSNQMQTLQLGLTVFYQQNSTQWNLLMGVVLLMSLPVLAIFLFSQRYFRDGISAGAVKQ